MCGMYCCGSEGLDCFQNRSPGGVLQSTRSVCCSPQTSESGLVTEMSW